MLQNRQSAAASRQRKKEYIQQLETKNSELANKLQAATARISYLEEIIAKKKEAETETNGATNAVKYPVAQRIATNNQ